MRHYGEGGRVAAETIEVAAAPAILASHPDDMRAAAARTLETKVIADLMEPWIDALLANVKNGNSAVRNPAKREPSTWPRQAKGVGFMEAPRGALAHWIAIRDGKIANHQAVAPSTWNAGPRDPSGQPGAYEAAPADRHHLAAISRRRERFKSIALTCHSKTLLYNSNQISRRAAQRRRPQGFGASGVWRNRV